MGWCHGTLSKRSCAVVEGEVEDEEVMVVGLIGSRGSGLGGFPLW